MGVQAMNSVLGFLKISFSTDFSSSHRVTPMPSGYILPLAPAVDFSAGFFRFLNFSIYIPLFKN